MGWTFTYQTRKEMIQENTTSGTYFNDQTGETVKRTCLAKQFKGNSFSGVLYSVWKVEVTRNDQFVREYSYIGVDLLQYRNKMWGIKNMDETMGPYYFSCPMKYLNMIPCPNSTSAVEWRQKVVKYWADRKLAREAKDYTVPAQDVCLV